MLLVPLALSAATLLDFVIFITNFNCINNVKILSLAVSRKIYSDKYNFFNTSV